MNITHLLTKSGQCKIRLVEMEGWKEGVISITDGMDWESNKGPKSGKCKIGLVEMKSGGKR